MPHISSKKVDPKTQRELEKYMFSILQNTDAKIRLGIFQELLTETEKLMLAKRIGILFMLKKGKSLYSISEALNISPSTAERFERELTSGKYTHITKWIQQIAHEETLDAFFETLVRLAFTGKKKTFKQFIDEM